MSSYATSFNTIGNGYSIKVTLNVVENRKVLVQQRAWRYDIATNLEVGKENGVRVDVVCKAKSSQVNVYNLKRTGRESMT